MAFVDKNSIKHFEIILDYSGGPSVVTCVLLKEGRGRFDYSDGNCNHVSKRLERQR